MDRLKALFERVKQLKPYRANTRYNEVRGNLLSSGIAYYGFFSIFPAFALAAVGFGIVLKNQPDLLDKVGEALNSSLPGFVKTTEHPDGLVGLSAPTVSLLTIGGIIAFVSLVLSGIGWMSSYRDGIRGAFGAIGAPGNMLTTKLRDLAVFVGFGIAFLLSAVLTTAVGALTGLISEAVSVSVEPWMVTATGLVVGAVVDFLILAMLLRVLSGLALSLRVLAVASLVGALLLAVVKFFGVALIASATRSPLLGSVAVVIGMLFWLNLIARIVLLSACWAYLDTDPELVAAANAANAPESAQADGAAAASGPDSGTAGSTPGLPASASADSGTAGSGSAASSPGPASQRVPAVALVPVPVEPGEVTRERDRTSLASGAVIGAGVALAVAPLARWLRGVLSRR